MDIVSHGLWAGVVALVARRRNIPVRFRNAFLWGIFPDLFAFVPLFVYGIWQRVMGRSFTFPGPDADLEPVGAYATQLFSLTPQLYELSHSLIIFALVFGFITLVWKKKPWAMGGWLLHILADIPTHSYEFYPTPFLWPLSDWKFDGFSWGQWWFVLLNYSLLGLAALFLLATRKKNQADSTN